MSFAEDYGGVYLRDSFSRWETGMEKGSRDLSGQTAIESNGGCETPEATLFSLSTPALLNRD